jgi:hypothetical protein
VNTVIAIKLCCSELTAEVRDLNVSYCLTNSELLIYIYIHFQAFVFEPFFSEEPFRVLKNWQITRSIKHAGYKMVCNRFVLIQKKGNSSRTEFVSFK